MKLFTPFLLLLSLCSVTGECLAEETRTNLFGDDVVFMYHPKDLSLYEAYGATMLAWGGRIKSSTVRQLESMGVHASGSMWCLTARAKELHGDPDLLDAVARDIEGSQFMDPFSDGTIPLGLETKHGTFGKFKNVIAYSVYVSAGPDRIAGHWLQRLPYSPTNGTRSHGELWRIVQLVPDIAKQHGYYPLTTN